MKNTDFYVKQIFRLLVEGYQPKINQHELIGGKTYRTATVGDHKEKYKAVFNGHKGVLLVSIDGGAYENIPISQENTRFILTLCRIFHKFLEEFTITKKQK